MVYNFRSLQSIIDQYVSNGDVYDLYLGVIQSESWTRH